MAAPSGVHSVSKDPTDQGKRAAREPRYKTIAGSDPNNRLIYTTPSGKKFSSVDRPCTPPRSGSNAKTFDYVSAWYSQDYLTLVNHRAPPRTVTLLGSIIARAYALIEGFQFKEFDCRNESAQDGTFLVIIGLMELIRTMKSSVDG
ncbi:hypothetical protein KCU65_g6922, partial [Aureobasidium melanogenum]